MRRDKICTSAHTGTSASAPIAAGICALALEANPGLSWRDMQHIVVLTSNPDPLLKESGWQTNGVGRKYSHKFGYGLMDAAAMVRAAKRWPGAGKQVICESKLMAPNQEIPSHPSEVARDTVTTTACAGEEKELNYLEHVQCKITLHYSPRGALHIVLTSPSGTKSSLLLPRPRDKTNSGFEDWPFLSVHFWGERANGTWTLEVNHSPGGPKSVQPRGILKKWKLLFYGTKDDPLGEAGEKESSSSTTDGSSGHQGEFHSIDDYYGDPQDGEEHEGSSPYGHPHHEVHASLVNQTAIAENSKVGKDGCSVECRSGCSGPGPHQCGPAGCRNYEFNSICVGACPASTFPSVERTCHPCRPPCGACFGPQDNQCLSCREGFLLATDLSACVTKCPQGYRLDKRRGHCVPCPDNCLSCTTVLDAEGGEDGEEESEVICLKCAANLLLVTDAGACVGSCPQGYFKTEDDATCAACDDRCETCIGPLASQCSLCRSGTFYHERRCVELCPKGFRAPAAGSPSFSRRECLPCPQGCLSCSSEDVCQECAADWKMNVTSGLCLPLGNAICSPGFYADSKVKFEFLLLLSLNLFLWKKIVSQALCHECHSTCASCTGGNTESCLSCHDSDHPLLHISSCVDSCPPSTYVAARGEECRHCPHACRECADFGNCTACHSGYLLRDGTCVANCRDSEFFLEDGGQDRQDDDSGDEGGGCGECHSTCHTCRGPERGHCLSCQRGLVLANGQCLEDCPPGFAVDSVSGTCRTCHPSCRDCFGPGPGNCKSCPEGFRLEGDTCLQCPLGRYFDLSAGKCRSCHDTCSSCSGPKETDCTHCGAPLALDPWNKTCVPCCSKKGKQQQKCCQCDSGGGGGNSIYKRPYGGSRGGERCLQPARGARKRSHGSTFEEGGSGSTLFGEPSGSGSHSSSWSRQLLFLLLLGAVAGATLLALHAVGRRRWRRTLASALAAHKNGSNRGRRKWKRDTGGGGRRRRPGGAVEYSPLEANGAGGVFFEDEEDEDEEEELTGEEDSLVLHESDNSKVGGPLA